MPRALLAARSAPHPRHPVNSPRRSHLSHPMYSARKYGKALRPAPSPAPREESPRRRGVVSSRFAEAGVAAASGRRGAVDVARAGVRAVSPFVGEGITSAGRALIVRRAAAAHEPELRLFGQVADRVDSGVDRGVRIAV